MVDESVAAVDSGNDRQRYSLLHKPTDPQAICLCCLAPGHALTGWLPSAGLMPCAGGALKNVLAIACGELAQCMHQRSRCQLQQAAVCDAPALTIYA